MAKKQAPAYDESSISVLRGIEALRAKPAMYIGGTDTKGMHHILWEIIDNAVDEALEGHGNKVIVTILDDNAVSVEDFGRGIPVGMHKTEKMPTIDLVLTEIHAGGKFHSKTYATSGGTHGIGASATNALSEWMKVTVRRDGKKWQREYRRGVPTEKGALKAKRGAKGKSGTLVAFKPDPEIFGKTQFKRETIASRLEELSYLLPSVEFILKQDGHDDAKYKTKEGIKEFVARLCEGKEDTWPRSPIYHQQTEDDVSVEFAIQYTDDDRETLRGYANNIYNHDGGVHISGFRNGLTRIFNQHAKDHGFIKGKTPNLTGDEVRSGMVGIVSVRVPLPQFEGQTKTKLCNANIETIVSNIVSDFFDDYLKKSRTFVKKITDNAIVNRKAKAAAKRAAQAVKRKGALSKVVLPGKLVDCHSKNVDMSELFIVEGDSAAGPAKQGRNSEFQAVMPIRGKSLNVEKASIEKILKNEELRAIIAAVGCGIISEKGFEVDEMQLSNLRYNKIVIMSDADVDGYHIRTLLLTFFLRYMRPLVEKGHLYVAEPPLFCIEHKGSKTYCYSEEELKKAKKPKGCKIKRFKGLGEQNVDELRETCMEPKTRRIVQVAIEDFDKLDNTVNILMGSNVESRKNFISEMAPNYT